MQVAHILEHGRLGTILDDHHVSHVADGAVSCTILSRGRDQPSGSSFALLHRKDRHVKAR